MRIAAAALAIATMTIGSTLASEPQVLMRAGQFSLMAVDPSTPQSNGAVIIGGGSHLATLAVVCELRERNPLILLQFTNRAGTFTSGRDKPVFISIDGRPAEEWRAVADTQTLTVTLFPEPGRALTRQISQARAIAVEHGGWRHIFPLDGFSSLARELPAHCRDSRPGA